ncbi:hypothetical protein ACE14D_04635 [Streptomyces sp. Act-28]
MKRYTIAVRRWWTVPAALALLVLVCVAAGAADIPVPSLNGGTGSTQLAYFTPVLVVVAVMYCLDRRLRDVESTAAVPVHRFDLGALVLTVVLAHAAGLVVGMDVARNITLLLALGLLTRRLANEAVAAAAGLLFLVLNVMLGRPYDPAGHVVHAWWALALHPAGSLAAWLVASAVFVLALKVSGPERR